MLKTAIVHDWLVDYAGSERVVESLANVWDYADIFTLVDFLDPVHRGIILKGKKANTSFIQKLPFAETRYRNYLPLFPFAIERFDLSHYKLILSSSHAVAKGVKTNSHQLHICYCHSPMRYAWDFYKLYLKEANLDTGIKSLLANAAIHYLRRWDRATSDRPDYFIANSLYIAQKIKRIYNRDADVIYPPVDVKKFDCVSEKENFYLTASRLVPYKRIDLIVAAFSQMKDKKLVVIGNGPEMKKIKSIAASNIEILGFQDDESLRNFMQKAKAFIFAAEEDFGIIVVESMACGTPVIALNKGGVSEIVKDKETGVFFDEQNIEAIGSAVVEFEKSEDKFDPLMIRKRAEKFDRSFFEKNIKEFVDIKANKFINK